MTSLIHFIQSHSLIAIELPLLIFIIVIAKLILIKRVRATQLKTTTPESAKSIEKPTTVITSKDIKAIAGDDVMVTQLDLARAYIEVGKTLLAKQILQHVLQNGSAQQKTSAQYLLNQLT